MEDLAKTHTNGGKTNLKKEVKTYKENIQKKNYVTNIRFISTPKFR